MKKFRTIFSFFLLSLPVLAAAQRDTVFITTSDSVKLYVERSGSGFPVLFIHGGPGSNSGYFSNTGGDVFSKDVQMIYLDQRGCGRSENAANGDYSLGRMILDFEEVRQALGLKEWMLMPHSFGGIPATEYAHRYPNSIRAIVYLNSTINIDSSAASGVRYAISVLKKNGYHYPELESDSIPLLHKWGSAFGKLQEKGLFHTLMFENKKNFDYHDSVTLVYAKHYEFGQKVWGYQEYFVDFSEKTASINVPVLVIGGTRDYTIGLNHPELFKFPNREIKYVPSGHAPYFEQTEILYDAVQPFLKKWSR